MKSLKKVLLHSTLILLVSTGLITFFPDNLASQASTKHFVVKKTIYNNVFVILSGTVTDPQGAVIPGATVVAKNMTTGAEVTTTTNENGIYRFTVLTPGTYTISVMAEGFKKVENTDVNVKENVSTGLDVVLPVGGAAEVVEVFGGEVLVERSTSQVSANYDARKVADLPLSSGSSTSHIIKLPPGVTNPTTKGPAPKTTPVAPAESNTEGYKNYGVNSWTNTKKDHLSTFAVDVDTGSYTIARRKLNEGVLPPVDSVRVEEFVNYFKYQYPAPVTKHPFSVTMEASASPFNEKQYLLRIGLKGREVAPEQRPAAHLTFLVDTSGSMQSEDKIGLVKKSLKMLTTHLQPQDTVAITTYAGGVSLVLPPTQIADKAAILAAIDQLESGGSTAMEAGIDLAYKQALNALQPKSTNRVIICSDGDANVGKTTPEEILKQIEGYVEQGITVSTIGFGMGNYKDTMMEQFANKGNGNYYYIDTMAQAKRIFVEQVSGTLHVIAKDVKVQVEFNPAAVSEYRLVGYENRDIADEDFRNDEVDAGEIGAGHTVTAIYEVKLQKQPTKDLATVRLRYKTPDANKQTAAQEVTAGLELSRIQQNFNDTSEDFRFSIAVAAFAEVLRGSQSAKNWSLDKIVNIAETSLQVNNKERQEFFQLVKKAQQLKTNLPTNPSKP